MLAARIHRFGPPEVIALDEIETPVLAADEVLVEVAGSGVGPWDAWVRRGKSVLEQPLPLTLGADLSGRVVKLGAGASGLAIGDEVFGVANARFTGANAELASVRAASMAKKPARVSFVEAAALPVVGVTALQMIETHAEIRAGQRVLIHGAGGAVGSLAVQIALRQGAHVIGTEVAAALDYVRSLGVSEVIESSNPFESTVAPVDAVIDTVGGDLQTRSFAVLRAGGVLVSSVSRPDASSATRADVRALFMLVDVTARALDRVRELVDAGALKSRLGAILPLAEARHAHQMLEGLVERPPGKIVLTNEGRSSSGSG